MALAEIAHAEREVGAVGHVGRNANAVDLDRKRAAIEPLVHAVVAGAAAARRYGGWIERAVRREQRRERAGREIVSVKAVHLQEGAVGVQDAPGHRVDQADAPGHVLEDRLPLAERALGCQQVRVADRRPGALGEGVHHLQGAYQARRIGSEPLHQVLGEHVFLDPGDLVPFVEGDAHVGVGPTLEAQRVGVVIPVPCERLLDAFERRPLGGFALLARAPYVERRNARVSLEQRRDARVDLVEVLEEDGAEIGGSRFTKQPVGAAFLHLPSPSLAASNVAWCVHPPDSDRMATKKPCQRRARTALVDETRATVESMFVRLGAWWLLLTIFVGCGPGHQPRLRAGRARRRRRSGDRFVRRRGLRAHALRRRVALRQPARRMRRRDRLRRVHRRAGALRSRHLRLPGQALSGARRDVRTGSQRLRKPGRLR